MAAEGPWNRLILLEGASKLAQRIIASCQGMHRINVTFTPLQLTADVHTLLTFVHTVELRTFVRSNAMRPGLESGDVVMLLSQV